MTKQTTEVNDNNDEFVLYDLRVTCVRFEGEKPEVTSYKVGHYFELRGEELFLPPGQSFSIYALGSLLALLAVKQRKTHPNDWISTDTEVCCPDPAAKAIFKIERIGERTFRHSNVSAIPLNK